jgi:hypothetical protein
VTRTDYDSLTPDGRDRGCDSRDVDVVLCCGTDGGTRGEGCEAQMTSASGAERVGCRDEDW